MLSWKKFLTCFLIPFTFTLSGCVDQARIDAQNRAIQQEVQRQQRKAEAERQRVEAERGEQERWNSLRNPTMPTADKSRSMPNVEFTNTAIDNGFKRWSSVWFIDRYIPNSARVTHRGNKDGTYIIRGDFSFARQGSSHTIPFVAAFTQSLQDYKLANLCYIDHTSGMTDCIDPSPEGIAKAQSRQFLGIVLAGGVAWWAITSNIDSISGDSRIGETQSYNIDESRRFHQNDLKKRQEQANEENQERMSFDYYNGTHTSPVPVPLD